MPMTRRCSYLTSSGRPCTKPGEGNPPLCDKHFEELEDDYDEPDSVVEEIFAHPAMRDIFGRVSYLIDRGVAYVDRAAKPGQPNQRPKQARTQQPPPRQKPVVEDPRTVLGFGPNAQLNEKIIKERKRQLASMFHPDAGGNTEAMARVNRAAEVLLASLKK